MSTHLVLHVISGVILITLAAVARELPVATRLANPILGVSFLVYCLYLAFIFDGDRVRHTNRAD